MKWAGSLCRPAFLGLATVLLIGALPSVAADRVVVAEDFTSVT